MKYVAPFVLVTWGKNDDRCLIHQRAHTRTPRGSCGPIRRYIKFRKRDRKYGVLQAAAGRARECSSWRRVWWQ